MGLKTIHLASVNPNMKDIMPSTNKLLIASLTSMLAGLVGCGGPIEEMPAPAQGEASDGITLDTQQQALESADIQCGHTRAFPTWFAWGYTTADLTNSDRSGNTTLRVMYQAGTGANTYIDVKTFAQIGGRWGGFPLNVTVLGYYNANGYQACLSNTTNLGAPYLRVQTY